MIACLWLLATLGLAVVLDLLMGFRLGWRFRAVLAIVCVALQTVASVGLVLLSPSVATVGILIVSAYSIFNQMRVVRSTSDEPRLFQAANITGTCLGLAQIALGIVTVLDWQWPFTALGLLALWACSQLATAIGLTLSARRQIYATAAIRPEQDEALKNLSTNTLPSITVAIPVRNEDRQLAACLDSILASDYPKLEVLALDDSSADRTPEIIKGYAHAGVRFVRGDAPDPKWLPKNQVYDKLMREASGSLILFCGADIRFEPQSIRALEALLHTKHKTMLDILPENRQAKKLPWVQAMRYYWEMAPARRRFKRPPVLSSCWLISREELDKAGGFTSAKQSISPESHIARALIAHDGYSFVRSDSGLGVTSEKDLHDQHQTAIYTRYPQLHRRPELVLLLSLVELLLLSGPLWLTITAIILGLLHSWVIPAACIVAAVLSLALNSVTFGKIQQLAFTKTKLPNILLSYIPALLLDIWLLHVSMVKYEFSKVIWKDRDVRPPVMQQLQVIPALPPLPPEPAIKSLKVGDIDRKG